MSAEKINSCANCFECRDHLPFFNLLSKEELKIINADRYSVLFHAGELILKQGMAATHVISLVEGIAKIYIEGRNNRSLLYQLGGPWQLIEAPCIHTDIKINFSVAALTNVRVCYINASNFRTVLQTNIHFSHAILKHLSECWVFYYQRLVSLSQKQLMGRMADGLLYIENQFYKTDRVNLNLSRQDIADLTAMSKDSAGRILKDFERGKIIKLKGKSIQILDKEKLTRLSDIG